MITLLLPTDMNGLLFNRDNTDNQVRCTSHLMADNLLTCQICFEVLKLKLLA